MLLEQIGARKSKSIKNAQYTQLSAYIVDAIVGNAIEQGCATQSHIKANASEHIVQFSMFATTRKNQDSLMSTNDFLKFMRRVI